MFGLGMGELIIIAIVALLALGPDKLPGAAKAIGKGIRDLKKQSRELQTTIERDTQIGDAVRDLKAALRGDDPPPPRPPPVAKPATPASGDPVAKPATPESGDPVPVTPVANPDAIAAGPTSPDSDPSTPPSTAPAAADSSTPDDVPRAGSPPDTAHG